MVALAGIENDSRVVGLDRAKFERAPREAMLHGMKYLRQHYGSVEEYLDGAGFSVEEQARLRRALTGSKSKHPTEDTAAETAHHNKQAGKL